MRKRDSKKLVETKARLRALGEENTRYQFLIRTSKKAGEVELLIRDNGYLRNKLKDQEEDFRLQNNTLLKELSKARLVGENEQYERQLNVLCSSQGGELGGEDDHSCTDDSKEVIRLRGELKEMQKTLFEAEARIETDSQAHTEKVSALSTQISQLTHILQTHSIPLDEGEISLGKGGGVSFKKLTLQDDDGLETDLERTTDTLQSQDKCTELQREVAGVQTALRKQKEHTTTLTTENARLEDCLKSAKQRTYVEELKESLHDAENKLTESNSNLAEKSRLYEAAVQSVEELEHKLGGTEGALQESRDAILQRNNNVKLAESRHDLMEEMKAHMEEEKQKQKIEIEQLQVLHKDENASHVTQNQQLKNKLQEINGKVNEMSDLNMKVTQLEQEKVLMKESSEKLLEDVQSAHRQVQEATDRVTAEKCQEIEKIKWEYKNEKSDLETQLEICTIQRQEAEEMVEALRRKVSDGEEEQRIHERKGVTLMKDLKKQLVAEKKRADRLQEKLSQLLTDPAQLTAITTAVSEAGDDVSSVSSWSLVSGEPRESSTRENSIIVSPQGSPPPGMVTEETVSLVNRLTEVQQNKWQLEERITHLESSAAAMADDLLKKSAIIQHFCMDHKNNEHRVSPHLSPAPDTLGDKLNVRRVLEMVRGGGGEESLREINRRLQNLLEETLGKNMQLHKDVENLSQQVHQLSKLAAVKTESDLPAAVDVYNETQPSSEGRPDTSVS
ncbi:GRIP1-associated protein 1 [Chionoecetes opilio]|uniref:GRIP1-associated protein 1 n=1 Tax=Chionoecetes opilio TaxID=41210 RepID=A0A8J5CX86_CHIOP|nr:GRIP1-associated protein 1 [Chionoecetes opilio]